MKKHVSNECKTKCQSILISYANQHGKHVGGPAADDSDEEEDSLDTSMFLLYV